MAWINHQSESEIAMAELCGREQEFSQRTNGRVVIDLYDQLPGYARIYFEKTGAMVAEIMREIRVLGFNVRRTKRK